MSTTDLREHLVRARLAGDVATSPEETVGNCRKLVDGDPRYTFGLDDWRTADLAEAVAAVRSLCGDDAVDRAGTGPGWIDPDRTLAAVRRHARGLAAVSETGGSVLVCTGHPTGLLRHYIRIADALRDAGCRLLTPLADTHVREEDGERRGVRYVGGVGCVWTGGDLVHTHLPDYADAMLDALEARRDAPDLVIGDHGMAGAAVARGLATLSIADVNDPALMLAQQRGRTDAVMVLDDNLAPAVYEPLTTVLVAAVHGAPG